MHEFVTLAFQPRFEHKRGFIIDQLSSLGYVMVIYMTIPKDMIISIIIYIYHIYVICGVISVNENI